MGLVEKHTAFGKGTHVLQEGSAVLSLHITQLLQLFKILPDGNLRHIENPGQLLYLGVSVFLYQR